ncbi:MAG TPA: ribonuclease P protein component [Candidatus Saccharimonadia bacterium]|nr:ribonuclease P protein component [Candidatus Saccharimonadia bacterium]
MITRRHRFHGYGSLKSVYSRGQTARGGLLNLMYARRDPSKAYRVAVVVSRKVSKSAVVRNRIRRRVFESIRRQSGSIPGGTDLVFTAFGEQLAAIDAAKLDALVADLLQKTGGQ